MRALIAVACWLALSVPLALALSRVLRAAEGATDIGDEAEAWLRQQTDRPRPVLFGLLRAGVALFVVAPLVVGGAVAMWRLPDAVTVARADGQLALAWPPGQPDQTTTTTSEPAPATVAEVDEERAPVAADEPPTDVVAEPVDEQTATVGAPGTAEEPVAAPSTTTTTAPSEEPAAEPVDDDEEPADGEDGECEEPDDGEYRSSHECDDGDGDGDPGDHGDDGGDEPEPEPEPSDDVDPQAQSADPTKPFTSLMTAPAR